LEPVNHKNSLKGYFSGTSGLNLPVPNKLHYPAEFRDKSRLCYYSSIWNSIEVNSSFYKIPMEKTMRRWAEEVPEGFRFTFKMFREVTHNQQRVVEAALVDHFIKVINAVLDRKGCLLLQFPPSLHYDPVYLKRLLSAVHAADPAAAWNRCLEFRDPSWYREEIYELLTLYNAALVIQDMPKSATPLLRPWTPFQYIRFHGPGGTYRGSYDDDAMREYGYLIRERLSEGKDVYAYFNNTAGDAVANLYMLNVYVNGTAF